MLGAKSGLMRSAAEDTLTEQEAVRHSSSGPCNSKDGAKQPRCRSAQIPPMPADCARRPGNVILREPKRPKDLARRTLTHVNRTQPLATPPHPASHPWSKGRLRTASNPTLLFGRHSAISTRLLRIAIWATYGGPYTSCALKRTLVQQPTRLPRRSVIPRRTVLNLFGTRTCPSAHLTFAFRSPWQCSLP